MISFIILFYTVIFDRLIANSSYQQALSTAIIITGVVAILYVGFFVLKAVAICTMAKKRGFKNWWLGMIPYANFYLLGKIGGPVRIFRMDVKNLGLVVLIASIILDAVNFANSLASLNLFPVFTSLYYSVYFLSQMFTYVIDIAYIICYVSLISLIFAKYAPQHRMLYTLLSLIDPIFSILLITVMNKKPYANADDYYREQMARRFGQTYNPYSNPYSTSENPFDSQTKTKKEKETVEDPFDEFK